MTLSTEIAILSFPIRLTDIRLVLEAKRWMFGWTAESGLLGAAVQTPRGQEGESANYCLLLLVQSFK
jgi:hypothetical protein